MFAKKLRRHQPEDAWFADGQSLQKSTGGRTQKTLPRALLNISHTFIIKKKIFLARLKEELNFCGVGFVGGRCFKSFDLPGFII